VKKEEAKGQLMLFEIKEALNHMSEICHDKKTINEVGVPKVKFGGGGVCPRNLAMSFFHPCLKFFSQQVLAVV